MKTGSDRVISRQQCSHFQEDLYLGGERQKEVLVPLSTVRVLRLGEDRRLKTNHQFL